MNFVLVNGSNISREKLRIVEDYFAAAAPGPLFILSRGKSLNQKRAGYTVQYEAFERLEKTIAALC
ncbi:MAG: hypothetical protein LBP60_09930 [Spirochaetaceae bacterium]|jgi:hypothetical protein|nr:hypothetical protein [Spirochaetaceae bacterium]